MVVKILLSLGSVLSFVLLHPIYAQDSPKDYLNAHNAARAEVGVGNLTWNSTIATYAQNYANQRMNDCKLVLSGGPYGENLARSIGDLSGTQAVNLWVSEKPYYDANQNTCIDNRKCGHYTQVVWQSSQHLGCGKVLCKNGGSIICCNYDPSGNVIGSRPYQSTQNQTAPTLEGATSNSPFLPPLISPNPEAIPPNLYLNPSAYPVVKGVVQISSSPYLVHEFASTRTAFRVLPSSSSTEIGLEHPSKISNHSSVLKCPTPISNSSNPLYVPPSRTSISNPPNPLYVSPSPHSVVKGVPPISNSQDKRKKRGLVAGIIVGASVSIGLGIIWLVLRWKRKWKEIDSIFEMSFDDEFENGMGPKKISYNELVKATNNFGEKNKLGEGGFGAVYEGFLNDLNCFVAVKKVSKQSKQGSKEYVTEVKIISRLRHKNIIKLIGWCHERELILVYEFMPNGSLDSYLFRVKSLLPWDVRYKIVQSLALALMYLHEEGDQCVLHRDIKSSNIMLDSEFNAKLGDFGLARLVDHAKGSQTTALAGTIGYMAPECLTTRKASKESDVFSFGIVALETVCGRRSIERRAEEAQISLVAWVWESYREEKLLDVVDKKLCMNFELNQMESLIIIGLWCAHPDQNLRPSIKRAIQVVNFESPLPILPSKMPIPKYDIPTTPTVGLGSGPSLMSLTIPR